MTRNASITRSMSASVCAAVTLSRMRLDPFGTVGGRMAGARMPPRRSSREIRAAASASPTRTGTIWNALPIVSNPSAASPSRRRPARARTSRRRWGCSRTILNAASAAALAAVGGAVV